MTVPKLDIFLKETAMSNEIDKADCPFSGHGEELINVKFFRGRRDDVITAEEMIEQARSAVMQHRLQQADVSVNAPVSERPRINVAEFVATL